MNGEATSEHRQSLQRRTFEGAHRHLHSVIREIRPLMETARTINAEYISFLNRPQSEPEMGRNEATVANDSFVINVEGNGGGLRSENVSPDAEMHNRAAILLNNVSGDNLGGNGEENVERAHAQRILGEILKYFPFVVILLAKGVYDNHEGIFKIIVLLVAFIHSNSLVKKEAVKRARRSISKLGFCLIYIIACVAFINFVFEEEKLYLNLVFVSTYDKVQSAWHLLWFVAVTDFILKLITVAVKIVVTMLPASVISYHKRVRMNMHIN